MGRVAAPALAFLLAAAGASSLAGCSTLEVQPDSAAPSDAPVREVTITAQKYHFTPDRIEVSEGDLVVLRLQSLEGTHGFALAGVPSVLLEEGKTETVRFYAVRKGSIPFSCDRFCGLGHPFMRGEVLVR